MAKSKLTPQQMPEQQKQSKAAEENTRPTTRMDQGDLGF